jgi:hypothetical protein
MRFLFNDASFSFETLRTTGFAAYGGADLGKVITTASHIPFRLPILAAVGFPWGRPLEAGVLLGILARSVLVGHYGGPPACEGGL